MKQRLRRPLALLLTVVMVLGLLPTAAFAVEEALNMIADGQCGTFNPALLDRFMSVEPKIRLLYEKGRKV